MTRFFVRGAYFLEKYYFRDPGIDDSFAIMYGLLHPEIEIVGIVTGYGNVEHIYALHIMQRIFYS